MTLPAGAQMLRPGDYTLLPPAPPEVAGIPVLTSGLMAKLAEASVDPEITDNPLLAFSLLGKSAEFAERAVKATPLLGELCLAGQATVWYAPPNAGKTLIALKLLTDAVTENRINPANVYYINADDSSEGFATKIALMDDLGVHTLAPGYQGFDTARLPELFREMADSQQARGALIIIDTIKKVASLMDKGKASSFTQACRAMVMAGATIVGFAHTNKNPAADGKLQYGGTSDLRDDFDATYIMGPIEAEGFPGEKVVSFDCIKSRGTNLKSAAYAYDDGDDVSYAERLGSVRLLSHEELNEGRRIEQQRADAEIIDAVSALIGEGDYAKMALARATAARTGVGQKAAIGIIEKYTGTDPATAKWTFERKERGAMIYTLLPVEAAEPAAQAA